MAVCEYFGNLPETVECTKKTVQVWNQNARAEVAIVAPHRMSRLLDGRMHVVHLYTHTCKVADP